MNRKPSRPVNKLSTSVLFALTVVTAFATTFSFEMPNSNPKHESKLDDKTVRNVVIAIAMEAEASPFVSHLSLEHDESFFPRQAPFQAFRGVHENCEVTVVTNGKDSVHGTGVDNVCTVPAALATFLTLQKLDGKADLLINAGTCGGFRSKGANVGDVFLTTAVANHDRRIPIPSFAQYGVGRIESLRVNKLAEEINAKLGVCTTGNSLDKHDWDDKHMKSNDASVKDMEAAAIAWSCQLHETPHFGVKVVTDIVDGERPNEEQFLENLEAAAKSLQDALPKVLEHVCGKQHDEL